MGKIAELLFNELDYIYCHNCENNDTAEKCDECSRKRMNWELSMKEAERIESKIIKLNNDA